MMKREGRTVMVFGVGTLQRSIIERARQMGLRTVGIDPLTDAACRDMVDVYEVVGGQDYEKTLEVANRYNVTSIVTAATDSIKTLKKKMENGILLTEYREYQHFSNLLAYYRGMNHWFWKARSICPLCRD